MNQPMNHKPHFKLFLSHRYEAAEINLYFYELLSEVMDIQFEVDEGAKHLSVTRLEILLRGCDGFLGIYPISGDPRAVHSNDELHKTSRYLQLEIDIASRARKPTLVFADSRYRGVIRLPNWVHVRWYDAREIVSGALNPSRQRLQKALEGFNNEVVAAKALRLSRDEDDEDRATGVVISSHDTNSAYTSSTVDVICDTLNRFGRSDVNLFKFPDLTRKYSLKDFDALDLVVVDVGQAAARSGIVGYLHGRFTPMLRMMHADDHDPESIGLHRCLYADIDVGYDKDLVRWTSMQDLVEKLSLRLRLIGQPPILIRNRIEALDYFQTARKLKEAVFLSYSSGDASIAERLSAELKKHFQMVFDYRDGQSIRLGRPWIDEIGENLQVARLGVQVISSSYLASQNCMQEARIMNNEKNQRGMLILPVKVSPEKIELPNWMDTIQYLHLYDLEGTEPAAKKIVEFVRSSRRG